MPLRGIRQVGVAHGLSPFFFPRVLRILACALFAREERERERERERAAREREKIYVHEYICVWVCAERDFMVQFTIFAAVFPFFSLFNIGELFRENVGER